MCGIALAVGGDRAVMERAALAMSEALRHRGPNDAGFHLARAGEDAPWVAMGHRRLSILDLSPLGHQPMVHPATGDAIVYNGEIYNHTDIRRRLERRGVSFRSTCDTEVLLHALVEWGDAALEELAGMYALAFFQKSTGRVLLARDPMGIKPLYIASTAQGFLAASEVRAILATGLVSASVDACGLAGYLAYGAVQDPFTLFEGVRSASAAHASWLRFDYKGGLVGTEQRRTWSFPAVDRRLTPKVATLKLRDAMNVAVREHLVADVPVGIFLSSGIDSAIVAALARQSNRDTRTFTLGFHDQPDLSESEAAHRIASELGTHHSDIQITGPEALATTREWIRTLDQPSLDGLNTYVISRAVRERGVVVALSGLGGDELFGGYASFGDVPRMYAMLRRMRWVPRAAQGLAFRAGGALMPTGTGSKLRSMAGVGPDLARLCLWRRRTMSDEALRALGIPDEIPGLDSTRVSPELIEDLDSLGDPVAAVAQMESRTYMRHMLLRDSDAVSMRHSLELRVPMLDRRVLDLAFTIPAEIRCPGGVANKHLLREAFADVLSAETLKRPKRGFTLPIRRWMHGAMREFCEAGLHSLKGTGLLDGRAIDSYWARFLAEPEARIWSSTFSLVVLGSYLHTTGGVRVSDASAGAAGVGERGVGGTEPIRAAGSSSAESPAKALRVDASIASRHGAGGTGREGRVHRAIGRGGWPTALGGWTVAELLGRVGEGAAIVAGEAGLVHASGVGMLL